MLCSFHASQSPAPSTWKLFLFCVWPISRHQPSHYCLFLQLCSSAGQLSPRSVSYCRLYPPHPEPGNRQASLPCHWGYGEFFWPLSLYVQTFEDPALNRILNINSPLARHKPYLLTLYGQKTSPASTLGVFMDLNGPRKWCSTRFFIHPAPRFPHTFWCTGASLSVLSQHCV